MTIRDVFGAVRDILAVSEMAFMIKFKHRREKLSKRERSKTKI